MLIYGIHPVLEARRAGRVREVRVGDRADARVAEIMKAAERAAVPVKRVASRELDRQVRGATHQHVVADLGEQPEVQVRDLVAVNSNGAPLVVVLDGIEDPHNLGAILRTVDAAAASGVIRQSRRAARLEGAAAKASAGAISHVRIAEVVNIARAIEELKALGVWTVGLAGGSDKTYSDLDLTLPTAFVVGAEGVGLRRLVRERCDHLVAIPMRGHVGSLNVSVATGVALFEAVRQRSGGGR